MSRSRNFAYTLVKKRKSLLLSYILISSLWYFSLFPGRLGFDYSKAIVMIQNGESTSLWTSLFWWYLRITSFDGRTIAISSLFCLIGLGFSLYYLSESLPGRKEVNRFSLLIVSISPLYGAFGVNVSHDVFQAAGILIFTGFHLRTHLRKVQLQRIDFLAVSLATVMVLTTHYGLPLVALNVFLFAISKFFRLSVFVGGLAGLVTIISAAGVTQVPTHGLVLPIMGDLKCVAQLKSAELSEQDWRFLVSLAPKDEWLDPKTCSFIDYSLGDMKSLDLAKISLDRELITNYLRITSNNPAVVAMAHFQRASIALPPPFFFGPPNQVTRNPDIPIGEGTNNALQSYPGVLHPSIDEPSVSAKIKFLSPLEGVAQAGIFVVNQASWFWGWGGLWLWPITLFVLINYKGVGLLRRVGLLANILTLHFLLLILAAPLSRYVLPTILLGLTVTVKAAISKYLSHSQKLNQLS